MRLRLELFVEDLDTSIAFYAGLGFAVERREHDYASLRWGDAVIGLNSRPQDRRGTGVEIVLEVEDLDVAHAAVRAAGHPLAAEPTDRPWGVRDFRLTDPDGYYLRITRGQTPRRN